MITITNLTPHLVTVFDAFGATLAAFPPAGAPARVREQVSPSRQLTTTNGVVPTVAVWYADQIDDLPAARAGTAYLVSRVTAAASPRPDLYFPFHEVRDEHGRIIGCRALAQFRVDPTQEKLNA